MRRIFGSLALCIAFSLAGLGSAHASYASYLKLEGLPGDSQTVGYIGWIEVDSWTVGHGFASSTGPAGMKSLTVTKPVDRSSTSLAAAAATGTRLKNAALDVIRLGNTPLLRYRIILHDVAVRSYLIIGAHGSDPMENIELGYSKIEWYQFSVGPTGTLIQTQAKFDVARNSLYP